LDQCLLPDQTAELEVHLSSCMACSADLHELKAVGRKIRELPKRSRLSDFLSGLDLRQQEAVRRAGPPIRTWGLVFASIAAGFILYKTLLPPQETSLQLSSTEDPVAILAAPVPIGKRLYPLASTQSYTNEVLYERLQDEGEKLGIQSFLAQQEPRHLEPFLGPKLGEPGTREQAEESIRQLAALQRSIETVSGKLKAVPIEGKTVQLLAKANESAGLALEIAKISQGSWSGPYSGGNDGQRLISDEKSWLALWKSLSKNPAPVIDFSRQQVAAIFPGPRSSGGYSLEITEAQVTEAFILVQYREIAPPPGKSPPAGPSSPYALRVIPRSDLPVRFEKIP
jgi:hypothetical protein